MPDNTEVDVTLVLASFNHASYLADSIASVAAQVGAKIRLIVTDDASTDNSVEVIERELTKNGLAATRIFHDRNRGICATFNEALDAVDSPYVAFLAADDWMEPSRFARQVATLNDHPDAALVYGDIWMKSEASDDRSRYSALWGSDWRGGEHADLFKELSNLNWIPAPSVMSRTAALKEVGGYDETLAAEDHDMWLRLARRHDFVYIDEPLVTWRRVDNSLTSQLDGRTDSDVRRHQIAMLQKHLGHDANIDSWLEPRLFHLAVAEVKSGNTSPDLLRLLRRCMRIHPAGSRLRHGLAAHLKMVGRRPSA